MKLLFFSDKKMLLLQNIKCIPVQLGVCRFSTSNIVLARRWKDKYAKEYESEFHNPVREVAGMKVDILNILHIFTFTLCICYIIISNSSMSLNKYRIKLCVNILTGENLWLITVTNKNLINWSVRSYSTR